MNALDDLVGLLAPLVRDVAREAGALATRYFHSGMTTSARVWSKSGGSPVTEADMAVDAFLKENLARVLPEAGWLSEETADDAARLGQDLAWIVDPIDGTRAFAAGSHDWSISIALVAGGRPVFGIVFAPAHKALFEARRGQGAFRDGERIKASPVDRLSDLSVAGPKGIVDRLEQRIGTLKRPPRIPSLALRLARVAEGSVDVGLVSANAHEWDIAAGDLILQEAGGILSRLDGVQPTYNQAVPTHKELMATPRQLHPALVEAMTKSGDRRPAPRRPTSGSSPA